MQINVTIILTLIVRTSACWPILLSKNFTKLLKSGHVDEMLEGFKLWNKRLAHGTNAKNMRKIKTGAANPNGI